MPRGRAVASKPNRRGCTALMSYAFGTDTERSLRGRPPPKQRRDQRRREAGRISERGDISLPTGPPFRRRTRRCRPGRARSRRARPPPFAQRPVEHRIDRLWPGNSLFSEYRTRTRCTGFAARSGAPKRVKTRAATRGSQVSLRLSGSPPHFGGPCRHPFRLTSRSWNRAAARGHCVRLNHRSRQCVHRLRGAL